MATRFWLQVNDSTGDIYANLRTQKDASGLPTEPGGSWVEVLEAEFALAADGERPSWDGAQSPGDRVSENPYPRLRFTPTSVELDVGDSPVAVDLDSVDRDGNPLSLTVTKRIYVGGTVQKYVTVSLVAGHTQINVPTSQPRIIQVGSQPSRGFMVEEKFQALISDSDL
jgi:hypothetical protein